MPQGLGVASLPDPRAQPSQAAKSLGAAELGEQPPGWTGAHGQLLLVTVGHRCPDGRSPGAQARVPHVAQLALALGLLPTAHSGAFRRLGEEGCEGCYRTKETHAERPDAAPRASTLPASHKLVLQCLKRGKMSMGGELNDFKEFTTGRDEVMIV